MPWCGLRLRRAMREFRPDLLYERYALNTFGGTPGMPGGACRCSSR
ncbi:MAG: hypothetical protein U1E76_10215 [Planctomycetota bacterium]